MLAAEGEAIGVATNNVAEYSGLVAGLDEGASSSPCRELEVVSDSELIVKQMRGEYKVKNEALQALSLEAARLARRARQRDATPTSAGTRTSWPTASSTRRSTRSSRP